MTATRWPSPARSRHAAARVVAIAAAVGAVAACAPSGDSRSTHGDVVARAAGRQLTVSEAAELLSRSRRPPVDEQSVRVLSEFWIDCTLLDSALRADSSLAAANLDALIAPVRDQAIIMKLRDQAIRADTTFTDAEVLAYAETQGMGDAMRREERKTGEPRAEEHGGRDENVRELRRSLAATTQQHAEGAYLDSVAKSGRIEFTATGQTLMREIASHPTRAIDPGAARQPIVSFLGGSIMARDYQRYLLTQPFAMQSTLAAASRAQLEQEARRLATNAMLLQEAGRRRIALTPLEEQAIRAGMRSQIDSTIGRVRELVQRSEGGDSAGGVSALLPRAIAGQNQLVPLGALGVLLRHMYASEIVPENFPRVLTELNRGP